MSVKKEAKRMLVTQYTEYTAFFPGLLFMFNLNSDNSTSQSETWCLKNNPQCYCFNSHSSSKFNNISYSHFVIFIKNDF